MTSAMRAIVAPEPGGVDALKIVQLPRPEPAAGEVLVRVFATALNRADVLQRRGLYPPPSGVTNILGLEFAGEIAALGPGLVRGHGVGDRVFGLLAGGGYAEFVCVPEVMLIEIPDCLSYDAAAAVPEAFMTAQESLVEAGGLGEGQSVLIHAAASGVGTASIQVARLLRARVFATAGKEAKRRLALELGAELAIDYRADNDPSVRSTGAKSTGGFASRALRDMARNVGAAAHAFREGMEGEKRVAVGAFDEVMREATGGIGVDLVLDLVGASHFKRNLRALRTGGRLVIVGLVGGRQVELNLAELLSRRLQIYGTIMRSRPLGEKVAITERFRSRLLAKFANGELRPVLDEVFPFEDVAAAHERMDANANLGKIVLRL